MEYSKDILQVGLWPDEDLREEVLELLDYNVYYRKSDCQVPYAKFAKEAMEKVMKLVIPILDCYKKQVLDSTYYWIYRDPDYLKLVYCTKYPNSDDQKEMESFEYSNNDEDEYDINSRFQSFLFNKQKEYGISDNDFILKAFRHY